MQKMNKNTKLFLISLFSAPILLILYYYNYSNRVINEDAKKVKFVEAENFLLNKNINSLSAILPDSIITNRNLCVMLYTGMDCGTCIEKGFETINQLSQRVPQKNIAVISSKSNIGRDQLMFNYKELVYSDDTEKVRQELKFIFTPVLILLDSAKTIIKVYFPLINEDENEKTKFIKFAENFIKQQPTRLNLLNQLISK
jgi:hypothetical protein